MATCAIGKIDSNISQLRVAEEECPKQLPTTPTWQVVEANSYNEFGGQMTSVTRNPINEARTRVKGGVTDMDVAGAFNMDFTATNLQSLLQGFMFADTRIKASYTVSGASADLKIATTAGTLARMTSTALNFTTLGIIPGEWIYIGGDTAASQFATAANNGFKRVKSVAANTITFDKSVSPMVTDAGTGKTITLYFGKVLKNETTRTLIKRRSYQFEQTLGSLDGLDPPQSLYLTGCFANEFSLNLATADKLTADLSYVGLDSEPRTQVQGLKAGNRPAWAPEAMFNTSSDIKRTKLSYIDATTEAALPMYAFLQEGTITINNGITPNKAIGVLGGFDASAGDFTVSGTLTAYFSDIRAVQAVRSGADVTFDAIMVKGTKGVVFDMPLLTLGDGRPNVVKDEPITLPLSIDANGGATVDPNMTHTAMWTFFDTLPALASTVI